MAKIDDLNKKLIDSKKVIKEEKKKIKKIKHEKRKKTKIGKFFLRFKSIFSYDKNKYSFSEVLMITVFSLVLGFFVCASLFMAIFNGFKYLKSYKELNKFYDVYETLVDNYYGEFDKEELVESAISGMVSSVGDTYTSYNDAEAAISFNQLVSGIYEGIGCLIQQKDDVISIIEIYDDSPSFEVGLKAGDIIKTVDDLVASEVGITKLAEYIKTESSGDVDIVILRDDKEMTFTLKRNKVEIPVVSSKVISKDDKKVGYISISLFSSVVANQFKKQLAKLEKEKIDALVIDVRGNNGGYLSSVTSILSYILPKGSIMYQVEKDGKKQVTKDKTSEKCTYPIAVLVNGNSASASEILAGAIKESYKGYVVGTKTFGKGTVQQIKKLADGSTIKYTTQNWLTPLGNWINEKGVEPTNEVKLSEEYLKDPKEENDNQLQEAINLVISN